MSTALATLPMNGSGALPAVRESKQVFSIHDVREMAESVAQSRLFPGINTVEAAFTLMMLCQAEGLHPMQALKRYHIIEGRPSMRADAMQSEFLDRGGRIKWESMDDAEARAVFSHPVLCPEPLVGSVTFKSLREHGITEGKFGTKENYKKHPDAMLRARLISKMVRAIDPGCITGMYTPEEVMDFGPGELGPESLTDNGSKPALPDNKSGHGKGAYASPEQVEAYGAALDKVVQHYNTIWADDWAKRNGGQPHDGVKDLLNKWQVDGHLLKWAKETGRLDPAIDCDKTQSAKTTKFVAVIYARGKADQAALKAEIKEYAAERTRRETEALLKKYPELAGPDDQDDPDDEPPPEPPPAAKASAKAEEAPKATEDVPGGDEAPKPAPVPDGWKSVITGLMGTDPERGDALVERIVREHYAAAPAQLSRFVHADDVMDFSKADEEMERLWLKDQDKFIVTAKRVASKLPK